MPTTPSTQRRPRPDFAAWLRHTNDITQQFLVIGGDPAMVSLAGGLPAAELYPAEAIRAATGRALSRWGTQALEYGPVEGLPALRAAIAERACAESGATLSADNVMITTGAMQGLDLVGKLLIDAGDQVVVQCPTYLGALDAWRARRPHYVPLDWNHGVTGGPSNADAVANASAGSDADSEVVMDAGADPVCNAKFIYAVPNFSNPTGVLVPVRQRQLLLSRATRANTWLLEDDPYCALQYDGEPLPSLLALDAVARGNRPYDGPVIYLGTFSKTIAPGLRIGWAIGDRSIIQGLARAKMSTDLSGCMFTQAVVLQLLEEGIDLAMRPIILKLYRERRDVLCAQAAAMLSEWFEWQVPPGGMFVWMRARDPRIDTDALYRHALQEKVAFVPGSTFDPAGTARNAMRVNFTRASPAQIAEGVARLARATQRYIATLR